MMSVNIHRSQPSFNTQDPNNVNIADLTAVVLDIHKKKVKIKKSKVKDIAKGLAEIAYSMGETNDIEEYTEEMTDEIFESLKKVERKKEKKKKRNAS